MAYRWARMPHRSCVDTVSFTNIPASFDPETHEAFATFSDSHPNDPNDPSIYDPTKTVDLGNYLGAQNGAVNLAAAVPEPETYAMLLAGLGLVGFAVRRRKHYAN